MGEHRLQRGRIRLADAGVHGEHLNRNVVLLRVTPMIWPGLSWASLLNTP